MAAKKTASKKTTGKRIRTGAKPAEPAAEDAAEDAADASDGEDAGEEADDAADDGDEASGAAAGLATARARAARIPKPVKDAYVPVTPIRYAPKKGGGAVKTEMPTKMKDGKEVPNVLKDIGDADLDAFFNSGAIRQHTTY
jgi:hypothetical protein